MADPRSSASVGGARSEGPGLWRWLLVGLPLIALGVCTHFAPLLAAGPDRAVLIPNPERVGRSTRILDQTDALFTAWLVGRHARTLATQPWRLTEPEHCAPARNTLALAPPMLSFGVLATPAWIATGNPTLAFNSAVLLAPILSALAVFLWIADWTRVPAAGLVAGIAYGLSPTLLGDPAHPFIRDLSWTAFALFFARRLLAQGRWRDAVGLGLAGALQIGASSYALIASLFVTAPPLCWLLWRHRLRQVRPGQLLLVALLVGGAAVVVLAPYLQLHTAAELPPRRAQIFASLRAFAPGGPRSPGLLVWLLAPLSVAWRPACDSVRGDPRPALLAALLLVTLVAIGSWLFALASAVLPLLDAVRVPANVATGTQLLLCGFAGIGAAALLARVPPRAAGFAAAGGVILCFVATLEPPWLGFPEQESFATLEARPDARTLEFFREIAVFDRGPLVEIPIPRTASVAEVRRILVSGWHGRRTSACFGSYEPPERAELHWIAARLPAPEAVEALRRMGFRTLLVHSGSMTRPRRFAAAARARGTPLRLLAETDEVAAFAIDPPRQP